MPGYWAQPRSCKAVCACAQELSSVWLCSPMNIAHQAPLSMRILQARILERVAISFSRGSSQTRDQTHVSCVSCIGRQTLYHWTTWETDSMVTVKSVWSITLKIHMLYPQKVSSISAGSLFPSQAELPFPPLDQTHWAVSQTMCPHLGQELRAKTPVTLATKSLSLCRMRIIHF